MGAGLALLVALAYLLGLPLLREMEGRATDWRFRYGRPNPPEADVRIVHADIDDNALETVGRWPWPRSVLAEAIAGLDRLGASVIALDLLLVDPQKPEYLADGTLVDHDGRLAAMLKDVEAKTVLGVRVDDAGARLSSLWTTKEGRRKWNAIRELLRADITLDRKQVVAGADLDGERAARVRGRLLAVKQLVVREAAAELVAAGRDCTVEALRAELLPPEKNAALKEFPALGLIRDAIRLQSALRSIRSTLPRAQDGVAYREVDDVLPPLPRFAAAVDAVGVVNSRQDRDGQLRRVLLRWEGGGRVYPQFGLAAAALHLGTPPERLAVDPLELGEFRASGEEMMLSWPRYDAERPIIGLHLHVSLGRVIAWTRAEEALVVQAREREKITRDLVAQYLRDQFTGADLDDPAKRPEIEEELSSEAEFRLGESGEEETPEEFQWRRWRNLTTALAQAQREVALARIELTHAVRGRLVFVGWYATGNFGDFFPTAVNGRTPGVVAHSIVANGVLSGYVVTEVPAWMGALVTAVLGSLAAFLASMTGPRLALLLTALLAMVYFAFDTAVVFGGWDISLALVTPLLAVFIAWAGTVLMGAVKVLREKAQLRRQFGARISKRLFEFLLENPETVHLAGEEREVTCFFSDLAGFTSISEQLDSRQTVKLLNRYMWAMNDELTKLNAYVNKFLGDGIMAVWGAFATGTPHAERACRAALACVRRLDKLNRQPDFAGLPRLSMRIGIATGVVTVGDCGAPPDLRDYTVIGDTANLAARLESANKQFGTRILINGRTRELLPGGLLTRPLGRIAVVGQQAATEVHELVAVEGEETKEERALIDATKEAVDLFTKGDFAAARTAWEEIASRFGQSPLADLYLEQLAAEKTDDFDGVVRLTAK